jgi:hypothetical protein
MFPCRKKDSTTDKSARLQNFGLADDISAGTTKTEVQTRLEGHQSVKKNTQFRVQRKHFCLGFGVSVQFSSH